MIQYNILNVKLSNSQLSKLKSGINYGIEITFKISSNVVGDSNHQNNFRHKLLLTNTQVCIASSLCIAFVNDSSANRELSKTRLYKKEQSGGF